MTLAYNQQDSNYPAVIMDDDADESDLKLVRASASLIADLQDALPKLLWRQAHSGRGRVHTRVKNRDLQYVIALVRNHRLATSRLRLMARTRLSHSKANRNCWMPS
jgi:hypothetical protein